MITSSGSVIAGINVGKQTHVVEPGGLSAAQQFVGVSPSIQFACVMMSLSPLHLLGLCFKELLSSQPADLQSLNPFQQQMAARLYFVVEIMEEVWVTMNQREVY